MIWKIWKLVNALLFLIAYFIQNEYIIRFTAGVCCAAVIIDLIIEHIENERKD